MSKWLSLINQQTSVGKEVKKGEPFLHSWWKYRRVQPWWKTVWDFLKSLKMEMPHDPMISLLGIYPENVKIPIQRKIRTPMFIAALFTIAKC